MESKDTYQIREHNRNSRSEATSRFRFWSLFSIFAFGFLSSGCEEGTPSLAPVSGKVIYQNQPLPRGSIVFVPDADRGSNGPLAQGTIQPDGSYIIQTGDKPGAMPGYYRVTVIAVEESNRGYYRPASAPHSLVPEKYRDPQLSDLSCEVKAGRENAINFNLTP